MGFASFSLVSHFDRELRSPAHGAALVPVTLVLIILPPRSVPLSRPAGRVGSHGSIASIVVLGTSFPSYAVAALGLHSS